MEVDLSRLTYVLYKSKRKSIIRLKFMNIKQIN